MIVSLKDNKIAFRPYCIPIIPRYDRGGRGPPKLQEV